MQIQQICITDIKFLITVLIKQHYHLGSAYEKPPYHVTPTLGLLEENAHPRASAWSLGLCTAASALRRLQADRGPQMWHFFQDPFGRCRISSHYIMDSNMSQTHGKGFSNLESELGMPQIPQLGGTNRNPLCLPA